MNERLEELKKKIEKTSEKVEPSVESLLGKTVFKAKIATSTESRFQKPNEKQRTLKSATSSK